MKKNKNQTRFRSCTFYSLISVYLLILAGGIVRSTGSGMGCPDWPRCFGQWIPPTKVSELPDDYKEVFKAKRHKKNEKLSKYLAAFNLNDLANQVLNEETDQVNLQFNVKKTYIEYINRVAGVITGFFIFLSFLFSFSYLKEKKSFFYLSLINLILVAFQGWIGSLVVSTDLLPWMVTVHMLLTLIIIAILIYQLIDQYPFGAGNSVGSKNPLNILLIIGIASSLIQMVWGTQVREEIDLIAKSFQHESRNVWIDNLHFEFILHRSFSWIILLLNVLLVYTIFKKYRSIAMFRNLGNGIMGLVLLEVVAGVILAYLSIPALMQPVHLFLAFLIFGLQFFFLLVIKFKNSQVSFDQRP
jgi:heme a synthase